MPRMDVMSRSWAFLVCLVLVVIMAMVKVNPVLPASAPKLEYRQYRATFLSGDVIAKTPVTFEAVDSGWGNPNSKWMRYIDSTESVFVIEDGEYPYSGAADMSFAARSTPIGRDILWVVVIRTADKEYWIGQKQSEGLVTSYNKATYTWSIDFDEAECTVYEAGTTKKLGQGDPKSFSMTIQRI